MCVSYSYISISYFYSLSVPIYFDIFPGSTSHHEMLNSIKIEVDCDKNELEEEKQENSVLQSGQNLVVDMESKVQDPGIELKVQDPDMELKVQDPDMELKIQDPDQSVMGMESTIVRSLNCSTEAEGEKFLIIEFINYGL